MNTGVTLVFPSTAFCEEHPTMTLQHRRLLYSLWRCDAPQVNVKLSFFDTLLLCKLATNETSHANATVIFKELLWSI